MPSWAGNWEPAVGHKHVGSPVPALPGLGVISVLGSCPWALAAAQHPETLPAQRDSQAGTPIPMHHLLPNERHSLGGLRHLLGDEEEEDSLGQKDVDGDGAFLPTRCRRGGKAEVGTKQWCGHFLPLAKSPHPKAELANFCHEVSAVGYLEIHTHSTPQISQECVRESSGGPQGQRG